MDLDEFVLGAAGHEACIGAHAEIPAPLIGPVGVELRVIDGARMKTLDTVFGAFAEVWNFPPRFAHNRSKDAFNDWMRDFDNLTNPDLSKPPARGYLTEIINAQALLAEQPDEFSWFAHKIPFYRDYYRDGLDPPAAFGVLLSAPVDQLSKVRERWVDAGVQVATVAV